MTTITHKQLAGIQLSMYASEKSQFDYYCDGSNGDQIVYGVTRRQGLVIVCFRGSVTLLDWIHDFDWLADPCQHEGLGPVHPGFLAGMKEVVANIVRNWSDPLVVIGHSLGASRADVCTGLLDLVGRRAVAEVVWAPPKSLFQTGADIVARTPRTAYWNMDLMSRKTHPKWMPTLHDPVPDFPPHVAAEAYVPCGKFVEVECVPPLQSWVATRWHSMELYEKATPETPVI